MISLDDIRAWCSERFGELREEGALSIVGLVHYSANGTETSLHACSSKLPADRWTPEAVATLLESIAARHARGLNGVQQFQLIAVYGMTGKPSAWLPFQRIGGLSHGPLPNGGLATESGPHASQQQSARLLEILAQGSFQQVAHVTTTQAQIIDKMTVRLDNVERRSDERWLALQNLLTTWMQQSASIQLRALGVEAGRRLLPLLPGMLSTLTGNAKFVSEKAVEDSLFDTLLENASPEELQELLSTISGASGGGGAALSAVLSTHLVRAKRRKETRDRERAEIMSGQPDRSYSEGEDDAAGIALRALAAKPPAEKTLNGGAALVKPQTNGHTATNGTTSHPTGEDPLLVRLFEGADANGIELLAGMYANRGLPDVARDLRQRYADFQREHEKGRT